MEASLLPDGDALMDEICGVSKTDPNEMAIQENYRLKHIYLKEKYEQVEQHTSQLRYRLQHVKKEISKMRRLKRVLIHRLTQRGDMYYKVGLEIPDDVEIAEDPDAKRRRERREKERERKNALREAARLRNELLKNVATCIIDDDGEVLPKRPKLDSKQEKEENPANDN